MASPDKLLFTPGPLTTSATVKQAMLRDLGSRDAEFIELVRDVRRRLLALGGVSQEAGYEAIPIQGSGTFGVEAMISSVVPPQDGLLVAINGAYGERVLTIAERHGIQTHALRFPEDRVCDPAEIGQVLAERPDLRQVAVVHCETTTGIMNPVAEIGAVCRAAGRTYLIDSMSAFGAVPVDLAAWGCDFLVSSSNKCIEGVPGFSFVLARREALEATAGHARTLSLDLAAQWQGLEKNGQFRFTPPTHALLAFHRALDELDAEGGPEGRGARYAENRRLLIEGMAELGIPSWLPPEVQGNVISTFPYPDHPGFDFHELYARLSERGFVIYPGKVTRADVFRIGSCGRLHADDMRALLAAMKDVLAEMGL